MIFARYKFRHIEHNNTTLCTHFQFITRARLTLGAVSNLHSTNCSCAPSVVWNLHFILVHPILITKDTVGVLITNRETPRDAHQSDRRARNLALRRGWCQSIAKAPKGTFTSGTVADQRSANDFRNPPNRCHSSPGGEREHVEGKTVEGHELVRGGCKRDRRLRAPSLMHTADPDSLVPDSNLILAALSPDRSRYK